MHERSGSADHALVRADGMIGHHHLHRCWYIVVSVLLVSSSASSTIDRVGVLVHRATSFRAAFVIKHGVDAQRTAP